MSQRNGGSTLDISRPGRNFNADDTAYLLEASNFTYHGQALSFANNELTSPAGSRIFNDSNLSFIQGDTSAIVGSDAVSVIFGNKESLEALHEQFHDTLEHYKDRQFSFDLIKEYTSICSSLIQGQPKGSEIEKWMFDEKNTWRLLHILMEDRLGYTNLDGDSKMNEADFPLSEKEVMLEVFQEDAVTRQSQKVVDWLEVCEADKRLHQQALKAEHFTDKTISWENTILQIKQKNNIPYPTTAKIVSEVDPDAPIRENLPIHKLDNDDEAILLSQLLSHIRCGQLEQAQKLCIRCGQPWRAATLEGWQLYHDPNISQEGDVLLPTEGNPNRDIWKVASWRLAEDTRMPLNARTMYAALCGHLEVLLLNMDTWHDWLWAHLKVMVDVRVEEEIRHKCAKLYVDMPPKYSTNKMNLPQIFAALAASSNSQVRSEHNKELISIQRYLILDDMDTLFASLAKWARPINDFRDPMLALLIRFAAHLVLVLRAMGKEDKETSINHGNEVLRAYTKFIVSLGNPSLIMSYVAKLPKHTQVSTLAQYLEGVTDPEKKTSCLELAAQVGLDAESAAQLVVESIRAREQKLEGEFLRGEATEEDLAKIEALDWLVVYPSQYLEALWQANALVRQFISCSKLEAARAAFNKLPTGTINVILQDQVTDYPDIEDLDATLSPRHRSAVREFLSLKLYLDAQHDFSEWFKFYHQQRPTELSPLPQDATFQQKLVYEEQLKQYNSKFNSWKKVLKQLAKDARSRLFNILTFPAGGWLGCGSDLDDEGAETTARRRELESLCHICIPEVALLIHEVSIKTGEPQGSIQLADIIASERYSLYLMFSKVKLRELLTKISDSCIDLLRSKKDPWGHPVTS